MWWWIVGGLVVLPLVLVGLAVARLRDARAELVRVAALAAERASYRARAMQPAQQRLREQAQRLAARMEQTAARAQASRGRLPGGRG